MSQVRLADRKAFVYALAVLMQARPIPIGIDDFRKVREQGLEFVDKSDLIRQIIDRPGVEVMGSLGLRARGHILPAAPGGNSTESRRSSTSLAPGGAP